MLIAVRDKAERRVWTCARRASLSVAGLLCLAGLSACSQGAGESAPAATAAAAPEAGPDAPAGETTTRIVGALAIRERIALPENAYAMVEVRNSAGPDAMPVVAEQRIDLGGAQPPIAFSLDVDRMRLPMDIGLAFRGAIFVDGRPRYVSDQIPVDLTKGKLDLGILLLQPFQAEAFATEMTCGNRLVRLSAGRDSMQINLDGRIHRLTEVASDTGTKLVSEDGTRIVFISSGTDASLAVGNEAAQPCTVKGSAPKAAGRP